MKIGEIYTGKVVRILDFGAFVELIPGTDGMVHISELANYRVPTVEDVVTLGEEITVVVKNIDPAGKVSLSRRMLLEGEDAEEGGGEGGGSGASDRLRIEEAAPAEAPAPETGTAGGEMENEGRAAAARVLAEEDGAGNAAAAADGRAALLDRARPGVSRRIRHRPGAGRWPRST